MTAITYTNDMDYQVARLLAAEMITEKPFAELSEETYQKAVNAVDRMKKVILTQVEIGEGNRRLQDLIDYAKSQGKLEMFRE